MTTKEQRRRELARAKLARQQARREQQERQRRRLAIIAAAVAVVLVIGGATYLTVIQNDSTPAADTTPSASATPTPTSAVGDCEYRPTGDASKPVDPPADGPATVSGDYAATITTNLGVIEMTLDADKAPCTVQSFMHLAEAGFYDSTPCHRLTTSETFKVLQCGDPTGSGSGGPGYEYNDEVKKNLKYLKGTVAMANSGPDTNGSQFFLVYGDTTLSPDYTVFGTITSGFDVLDAIAAGGIVGDLQDGAPKTTVTIVSVTVEESAAPTSTPSDTASSSATPSGSDSASSTPTGTAS